MESGFDREVNSHFYGVATLKDHAAFTPIYTYRNDPKFSDK